MVVAEKLNFIIKQNEKNKLSHAFLIETNNIYECLKDVKYIVKVINKTDNDDNIEKLIDNNNLPSLVIIEPDGLSIKKFQMEELEKKFSTKPIFSKYNTYIILEADKMNDSSSNAILKFLEEPENNIIGFLIVNNKENVLPTIKSRCEIVHVDYNVEDNTDPILDNIVDEYINKINVGNDYLINKELIFSNYNERTDIEKILELMLEKYFNKYILNINNLEDKLKYEKMLDIIQKKLNFVKYNGNLELILDSLVIEMRRIND